METLPPTTREVRLARRPRGLPVAEDLALVEAPLSLPLAGQVLVRNHRFHVFASLRMLMAGATAGTPFGGVEIGGPLPGDTLGEVVAVGPDTTLPPGTRVRHLAGWRDHVVLDEADCRPAGEPDVHADAELGHVWTTYAALTRCLTVSPGSTVLVTAAGSTLGAAARPIARLLGAGRVVGITGTTEKARRLVEDHGWDAAVGRSEPDLAARLRAVLPDGADLVLDLAGGVSLRAALDVAADGARVALVGALAGQLDPATDGAGASTEIDTFAVILRGLELVGFSADHVRDEVAPEWASCLTEWVDRGRWSMPTTVYPGLDRAAEALVAVTEGRHVGLVLVDLDDARTGGTT